MKKLANADFKILQLINDNPEITETQIAAYLPKLASSIEGRTELLERYEYIEHIKEFRSNIYLAGMVTTEKCKITSIGKKALEDYYAEQKSSKQKLWEDRFWKFAPLLVSVLSLVLTVLNILEII